MSQLGLSLRGLGWGLACLACLGLTACDDDAEEPVVTISGNHSVVAGQTVQLSATTIRAQDPSYNWSSSNTSVATVDANGLVTGLTAGEAEITARGARTLKDGKHAIVVVAEGGGTGEPVVTIAGDVLVLVGETVTLTASTTGGSDASYSWSSSDQTVATVDATGVVKGIASGKVTITATGATTGKQGVLGMVVADDVPYLEQWRGSGHADQTAEAFRHWDEDDPAEVEAECAKCHSTSGYRDYIGDDGTAAGTVEAAVPVGEVIECKACHNATTQTLSHVVFPSGVRIDGLGAEARCMTCHQGRSSTDGVNADIAEAAPTDDDTVDEDLGFINIHYYPAGATLNAGRVRGGYQYADKVYDWRFRHVPSHDTCIECHNPHTLEINLEECKDCHTGVSVLADLRDVRMIASKASDFDGDGDTTEGIHAEIVGLQEKLLDAIEAYIGEKSLTAICYSGASYPYFFKDTNADGTCQEAEADYDNRYAEWTARLLRAAYNYQMSQKDPGGFAHNAKYLIQLLFDSIADLNTQLTTKIDMTAAVRTDPGHFNGAGEAARHWDEDAEVEADCAKCHGGSEGLRFYLEHGVGGAVQEQDNGLDCATCHDSFAPDWKVVVVDSVKFPSGVTFTTPDDLTGDPLKKAQITNLCSTCHSGREARATVDAHIAEAAADPEVDLEFKNVHYHPAAASRKGALAKVGYQYKADDQYSGEWASHSGGSQCIDCHQPAATNHAFALEQTFDTTCGGCHSTAATARDIRTGDHPADYDGDGNCSESVCGSGNTETLYEELHTLGDALLDQIVLIAANAGHAICYNGDSYPYFMADVDTVSPDGLCNGEEGYDARYQNWTADLLKAAFNYQFYKKEPGAWAHNFDYMAQLLIDSIEALGGSIAGFTRPTP